MIKIIYIKMKKNIEEIKSNDKFENNVIEVNKEKNWMIMK